MTVTATDGNGLATSTTVTVTVTNVNDNAPAFLAPSYAFTLTENEDGSTTAVAVGGVAATDADGDAVVYSIVGGNTAGLFDVDPNTGALTYVGGGEDHEATASFNLTVRATDAGGLETDAAVAVTVTNVNDNAPAFGSTPYAFTLAENADGSTNPVAVGTVDAPDADGDNGGLLDRRRQRRRSVRDRCEHRRTDVRRHRRGL